MFFLQSMPTNPFELLFLLGVYLVPTWIALIFRKRHARAIGLCNVLLCWFAPLWIVAILWAIGEPRLPKPQPNNMYY